MASISPSSAAYARYVSHGQRAIAAADIFPAAIVEIVRSYTALTRPEFYHFVLKQGNVLGVLTRCDKKYRAVFFVDESLLIEEERKWFSRLDEVVPKAERHLWWHMPDYKKITIDNQLESELIMHQRAYAWSVNSNRKDHTITTEGYKYICIDLTASIRESFSREADLLIALM